MHKKGLDADIYYMKLSLKLRFLQLVIYTCRHPLVRTNRSTAGIGHKVSRVGEREGPETPFITINI